MSISLKTHKMLWARSGNCCAFEKCRKPLVTDISETDGDISIVGEEAHIVARELDGPRGQNELSIDLRDKYRNLILLCHDHHKIIDDHPDKYPVEELLKLKELHEGWVKSSITFDNKKNKDDEMYASYVDELLKFAGIDEWTYWSNDFMLASVQKMSIERHEQLTKLPSFIRSRIWPGRYPSFENAFQNIAYVVNDLLLIYDEHGVENNQKTFFTTERFYKIEYFPRDVYQEKLKEYNFHVCFVLDLMLEFTRSLNLLFDLVREHLFPSFRIKEGALMVNDNRSYNLLQRPEYIGDQRKNLPYKGFEDFMLTRSNRDLSFGQGISEQYG